MERYQDRANAHVTIHSFAIQKGSGKYYLKFGSFVEVFTMASPMLIATFAAGLAGLSPLVGLSSDVALAAGDCSAAAAQVVADTGGQLLSAQPSGDSCVITVLVQGSGTERPRRVRVKVPM